MYRLLILAWSSIDIVMLHHYLTIDSNFDTYEDSYDYKPDSNFDSYEDSCEVSNHKHAHHQLNQRQTAKEVEKKKEQQV